MARPRSIPEEDALERALRLFWRKGYDRTSLHDLCDAMGTGPSSIYNAFGNKEALFFKALDRYMATHAAFVGEILSDRTVDAATAVRSLLGEAVRLYTARGLPNGCALMQSGGSAAPQDSEACAITAHRKADLGGALRAFLTARVRRGDHLSSTPKVLSQFLLGTLSGLSQLAKDGARRRELLEIVDHVAKGIFAAQQ